MSSGFLFTITSAGLDALVDAQNGNTNAIVIPQLGISASEVDIAPTLLALPNEIKRIDTLSGESVSETIIHMTAFDASTDVYEVRSLGLYLADGTLFAAYSREVGPIFRKVDIATFLFSIDVAFADTVAESIVFGDATFLYPPATESTKGVAELATQAETDAEEDDQRIVTPLKLGVRLAAALAPLFQAIADEVAARTDADADEATTRADADIALGNLIAALTGRTITGSGLVTGGGDLSASRVLTVLAANAASAWAGTDADRALTPAALGPIRSVHALNGRASIISASASHQIMVQWGRFTPTAQGTSTVTFPLAFTTCYGVFVDGGNGASITGDGDHFARVLTSSVGAGNFQVSNDSDGTPCMYFAIGEIAR